MLPLVSTRGFLAQQTRLSSPARRPKTRMASENLALLHARLTRRARRPWATLGLLCAVLPARAETASAEELDPAGGRRATDVDQYDVTARSATYVRFFQRALVPGPGGAELSTDTLVPVYEYVYVKAIDLDSPFRDDAVDVELSAWSGANLSGTPGERGLDGDVTVANISHRLEGGSIKFGRQTVAAGTLRLRQLDGVSTGMRASCGLGVSGYAGLTVLPRWSERPGYHHLGSAADSLLQSPDALVEPTRADNWLGGFRLDYTRSELGSAGVTFHEEREQSELGRRDLGLDAAVTAWEPVHASLAALLDLDSTAITEGLAAIDATPTRDLLLTAEYRRIEPRLLLSRQSVLSVFETGRFDELGGEADWRIISALSVGSSAYVEWFGADSLGSRLGLRVRANPDPRQRLRVQVGWGRVREPQNGYHSGRVSLQVQVVRPLRATYEHYAYFYDEPIREIGIASVEAANLEWHASAGLRLLLGASLARSPYASLDAQTLLRAIYDIDVSTRGGP
jgi:hypothetical protein